MAIRIDRKKLGRLLHEMGKRGGPSTQSDFAAEIGYSQPSISKAISKGACPSLSSALHAGLERFLGRPVDESEYSTARKVSR